MRDYIQEAKDMGDWYHAIKLSPDYVTPSYMGVEHQWENNRKVRDLIDYKDKLVLDLGTMDGMWAFEAEQIGAAYVVAADVWQRSRFGLKRFLLARDALKSKVLPVINGDVHCIYDRVKDTLRYLDADGFDIVQCLGLLYHIQNPMLALHQIRKTMITGGILFLETAFWESDHPEPMARYNSDNGVYEDASTYWALNKRALFDVLKVCGFEAKSETESIVDSAPTQRIAILCEAVTSFANLDNFGT